MNLRNSLRPIWLLFIGINFLGLVFYKQLKTAGVNTDVFLAGHIFVFTLTIISFYLLNKGLNAKTTFNFMSSVYGSFLMKLVLGAAAVVGYVMYAGEDKNLPAVFANLFLYLLYTFLEMRGLLEISKKK
jgi:hypothetical protein